MTGKEKTVTYKELYNTLIRFDLIPKNNRYKNKTHKETCESLENYFQKLDTCMETFLYALQTNKKELNNVDKFCMLHKTTKEYIDEQLKEVIKTVLHINKIRKFLTEPYAPNLSLGFIKKTSIKPYYYKKNDK